MRHVLLAALPLIGFVACGTTQAPTKHGTMSDLSRPSSERVELCEHKVPKEVCTRCNPQMVAKFKSIGDWCPEHDVAESQCLLCHPDLTFEPLPKLPPSADFKVLSPAGEDVVSLADHVVKGKVTIFDFYADWCAPCKKVDAHIYRKLQARTDIAYRKLNVVSWETPLAKRHLAKVPNMPYLVVHGVGGGEVGKVSGLDLSKLDRLIDTAARQ
jgi:thiol-disulfide isomerase/thioredoxin